MAAPANKILLIVLAASTLVMSACSSSGGAPASSSNAAPSSGQNSSPANSTVEVARAQVTKYEAVQPAITVPALSAPVPKNVNLSVLTCELPVCSASTAPAVTAAKKLGWTVKQVQFQTAPEQYVSAWKQTANAKPNAVIYVGPFPIQLIKDPLAKIAAAKTPTVVMAPNAATPAEVGSNYAVAGAPALGKSGELMGDVMVADAGGPAKVLFIWDPVLKNTLAAVQSSLKNVVTGAGGSVDTLDVSIAETGKSVPGQVINYLQTHTDIRYLAFSLSDFAAGVPQALQAAGLSDKVKIVSRAPQAANLADIKNGTEFASVAEEVAGNGYRAVDDIIRLLSGQKPTDPNPVGWHQIFVKSNVTQATAIPPTPGIPNAFYKAWGVAK